MSNCIYIHYLVNIYTIYDFREVGYLYRRIIFQFINVPRVGVFRLDIRVIEVEFIYLGNISSGELKRFDMV